MKYFKSHSEFINEAKLSVIHKAAKKGSYPVSIVVIKDGKVIAQELVNTPAEVPAAFNVIKNYHKHKGATVHVESKTGERLFSESVINEFGPMAGSGNRNYSTNDLIDRIGDLDDILTSDRKAEREWEEMSQNYLDGQRGSEYWGDLGDQELQDAIDDAESLMKKYRIKESVNEAKFTKKSLMRAMKKDDGMIQLGNGKEYVIYNPNNGNDDNTDMWQDKVIFGLDQDGEEHEIKYSDIVRYDESRKINLKQDHLSSEEYQKAKKLKDFNKEDWKWNSKSSLYDRVNEATDLNDPVLVAYRATSRDLPKLKIPKLKSRRLSFDKYMDLLDARLDIDQQIKDLRDEMAQTLRDMEQEAEPEGGEVADRYGSTMMKQEKEYTKLMAKKDKIMARIDKHRMA